MKLVQCPNGHFYNEEVNPTCPVCGALPGMAGRTINVKAPPMPGKEEERTVAMNNTGLGDSDATMALYDLDDEDSPTVSIYKDETNWAPVVGWIVCIEGKSKGRDYRLHPERNFIGRAGDMDVSVFEDDRIAMRHHCSIVFEPNKKDFILVSGSESTTYYNGTLLESFAKLSEGDKFTIGASTFVFVPYCKGDVSW